MAGRLGVVWGPGGTRRRTAESTWRQVERWNRKAACRCRKGPFDHEHEHWCPQRDRPRVFPSLCDIFESWQGPILDSHGEVICHTLPPGVGTHQNDPVDMDDVRRDFFALVDRTSNLDWLLLTKRAENVRRMWKGVSWTETVPDFNYTRDERKHDPFPHRRNVWLLYSASDQESLEAGLPHLLACRDLVPVLGLSLEPLVGPVDLMLSAPGFAKDKPISWCVVGGESGPRARPMEIAWLESIVDQCRAAGLPCFVKQDSGQKPGQQGRISDTLWSVKQFPRGGRGMLILAVAEGERVLIGDEIVIEVVGFGRCPRGRTARLGFTAPREVPVDREVVRRRIEQDGRRPVVVPRAGE